MASGLGSGFDRLASGLSSLVEILAFWWQGYKIPSLELLLTSAS